VYRFDANSAYGLGSLGLVLVLAVCALSLGARADGETFLVLDPSIARIGDSVTVHGIGFCAKPNCSTATLLVDGEVVASGLKPDDDGYVVASFFATAAGTREVVVRQEQGGGGSELETSAILAVGIGGQRKPPPVEP
jgi:hypothetical protein